MNTLRRVRDGMVADAGSLRRSGSCMPQAVQIHQAYKAYLTCVNSCPALTLHHVSK